MRPPRGGHKDANQEAVVKALRDVGISVLSLAGVGNGCGDLLCAYRGVTLMLELKNPDVPPSGRRLTQAQVEFIASWQGLHYVVTTPDEALRVVVEAARPKVMPPSRCTDCGRPA